MGEAANAALEPLGKAIHRALPTRNTFVLEWAQ
jgi:hypothetical protein